MKNLIKKLLEPNPNSYSQKRVNLIRFISFLSFFIIISFVLNALLNIAEEKTRDKTIANLQSILNSSHSAVKNIWAEDHFTDAKIWASDPDLVQNTKELLKIPRDSHILLGSEELVNIRTYFKERLNYHYSLGIFIISPDFLSIASLRGQNIGTVNFIANEYQNVLP